MNPQHAAESSDWTVTAISGFSLAHFLVSALMMIHDSELTASAILRSVSDVTANGALTEFWAFQQLAQITSFRDSTHPTPITYVSGVGERMARSASLLFPLAYFWMGAYYAASNRISIQIRQGIQEAPVFVFNLPLLRLMASLTCSLVLHCTNCSFGVSILGVVGGDTMLFIPTALFRSALPLRQYGQDQHRGK